MIIKNIWGLFRVVSSSPASIYDNSIDGYTSGFNVHCYAMDSSGVKIRRPWYPNYTGSNWMGSLSTDQKPAKYGYSICS